MISLNEFNTSFELGLIYGIIAIGVFLTFRLINFTDLTCDGSFILGGSVSITLIKLNYSPYFSLIIAMIIGAVSGIITGILNQKFRISDLLSGILVAFMLYSVNLKIMGGMPNISLNFETTIFSNNNAVIILFIINAIIIGLTGYLLNTDFGLALQVIGQNLKLAELNNINISFMTIFGVMLSNSYIALGGALFSQYQSFVDLNGGNGTVIIALAAVIIGEKLVRFGSLSWQLIFCVIGSIIYRILISFALYSDSIGFETQDLNLVTGIMIILIMILPKKIRC